MKNIKIQILLSLLIGAGVTACSFGKHTFIKTAPPVIIDNHYTEVAETDSLIAPYKRALDKEMNEVIATAKVDFINERPSGNLGNLIADILLEEESKSIDGSPVICLINFGGLRAPLNKGNITLGDVYKLMPFDNQVVYVKMPGKTIYEIRDYLEKSGGEPTAGFLIEKNKIMDTLYNQWSEKDYWVITSDYLFNGGDKMYFFQKNIGSVQTGKIFRDVLIDYIQKHPVLSDKPQQRITW